MFFLLILTVVALDIHEEENVLVLSESNFDQAIDFYNPLIVEFYAPWCQHCQKLAPEYSKAAFVLKNDKPSIYLAKVDATEERSLANKYLISSYPTIKLFRGNEHSNYEGDRTEGALVNWARKMIGSIIKRFSTAEDVQNFISVNHVTIILFDELNYVLERIANDRVGISFAYCPSNECLSKWGVGKGTIVMFKKFDEGRNDYRGSISIGELNEFIDTYSKPLLQSWTEITNEIVVNKKNPALFLFRNDSMISLDDVLKRVSRRIKGKLLIIVTDITESSSRLAEHMGIISKDLPVVSLYDTRSEVKRYKLDSNISEDNIIKFVEQWEQGMLKQSLKSQEIPSRQEEASITIVGKNFWNTVMEKNKDVVVLFYAPWCQHSQAFARIYEDFADEIEDFEHVVLAKIDITNNDIDGINVTTYPNLKLWPAFNKDKPIDYTEGRDRQGLIEFLEKHTFNKIYLKDEF
jgi:protein disulfide-isomerase A1